MYIYQLELVIHNKLQKDKHRDQIKNLLSICVGIHRIPNYAFVYHEPSTNLKSTMSNHKNLNYSM